MTKIIRERLNCAENIDDNVNICYIHFSFVVPWARPTITSVFNTSSTSIKLQWRPIPDDLVNGILLGYKVVYQAFLPGSSQNFTWTNASTTSVELQGLEKFTLYLVGVSGYTRKGAGGVQFTHLSTGEDGKLNVTLVSTVKTLMYHKRH